METESVVQARALEKHLGLLPESITNMKERTQPEATSLTLHAAGLLQQDCRHKKTFNGDRRRTVGSALSLHAIISDLSVRLHG